MVIRTRALVMGIASLILVVALAYGTLAYADGRPPFGPSEDAWSGVFLTNGQAYFGHFYSAPGEYAILRDVYYVLAQQLQSQDPNQPAQTRLSLQRLGSEIHGPKPEMKLAKSQILFVEELRSDSPLVQSIKDQKSAPPATQQPSQPQPLPTASPSPLPSSTPGRSASPSPR